MEAAWVREFQKMVRAFVDKGIRPPCEMPPEFSFLIEIAEKVFGWTMTGEFDVIYRNAIFEANLATAPAAHGGKRP